MSEQQPAIYQEGTILLIDKEKEWTSFDVVNFVRAFLKRMFRLKKLKIGHAGTLDPLATGLLVLCTGKYTKSIETIQQQTKEYTGTIQLGETTPSFDRETDVDQSFPIDHISDENIMEATKKLTGELEQVPPTYSAVKIKGKRAYQYARNNEEIEIKSKKVQVHSFEITRMALPEIDFRIECSKGTYIRSIARDFGKMLESGAYLSELRRTRIGDYKVEDAMSIQQFREKVLGEVGL
ncbi:MAG: tRNA pseudouridine(55) synthase TruB [Bacteroidales bacterium]|nr:tRNA pseudouridine(55) synthase TruB [Bacteroidales bacterium]